MEKLRENRSYIVVTSLVILIPMIVGFVLWPRLPDQMATHFGSGNVANGWSSKEFSVIGLPLFILGAHLICTFAAAMDPKKQGVSSKIFKLVLLICPLSSLLCGISIYGYALSYNMNMELFIQIFVGFIVVVAGNYLPKCRQNYTVGIKLPWTLADEENWNRTHRLAGWIWVLCGLFFIINSFLNIGGTKIVFTVFAVMILIPTGYSFLSYLFSRKEK